jgi:hypothetical protein
LYRYIDRRGLPAYKFGRVIRLQRFEVEAWIDERKITPGSLRHLYHHEDEA